LLSEIEPEDRNIKSDLYELSIYDHTIHISPGKTIEDDEIKNLVYCYVYVVKQDKVVQKLGVYERFTTEKEDFFDLSTFEKGTLCLFEKYETNPSLFLDFKTDEGSDKMKVQKKSKKSKAAEAVEVDLNAEEPAETPKVKSIDPNEVDLNASEPKQEPVVLNAVEPVEVDLNAPEPETLQPVEVDLNAEEPAETKPKTPSLLDVNELERDLGTKKAKTASKGTKIKLKAETPKVETELKTETPETKPATKPKTVTKKTKPKTLIQGTDAPGTKFG
jgi:hypothetical protein